MLSSEHLLLAISTNINTFRQFIQHVYMWHKKELYNSAARNYITESNVCSRFIIPLDDKDFFASYLHLISRCVQKLTYSRQLCVQRFHRYSTLNTL
jgi:hypothetical protein